MFQEARRSLRVLTRPLAYVYAPKHTAVSPPCSMHGGLFYVLEIPFFPKDSQLY